jgi:hypothetical protein
MSGHTPGPWNASCVSDDSSPGACHCGYIFDGGDKTIAKVMHNDPSMKGYERLEGDVTLAEKNANAMLISVAPEMWEIICKLNSRYYLPVTNECVLSEDELENQCPDVKMAHDLVERLRGVV